MTRHEKYSKELLNGKVFLHSSVGYASKDNIYWNENLENKTYQIYAHSLGFLNYLTKQYEDTEDEIYLDESEILLLKWLNVDHLSKFIMHEQSVAARLINILRFLKFRHSENISDKLLDVAKEHIEFLLDDANYKKNNHGIMMDTSLSISLEYMPESLKQYKERVIEKVITRSKEAINRDFSQNFLHLENSPDYHRLTVLWLKTIEKRLKKVGSTLGKEYIYKLDKASSLDAIIAMPNLRYPIYGDSSDGRYKGNKDYSDFIDTKAGRVIFQNQHEKSQLTFIAGYGSKGHKHYDDLSFIFYDGREVLLNDSGKYNYDKNDKLRKHMISPLAHNSLSIYNKNYVISNLKSDQEKIYIKNHFIGKKYKLVTGINKSYDGVKLTRNLAILNNDVIVIYDQFESTQQNTIAVNFNLGLNITAERLEFGKFLIKGKRDYILQSHKGLYTCVLLNDSDLTPCKISNTFNRFKPNQRILYRQKTRNGTFLTTLSSSDIRLKIESFDENGLILKCNDESYTIVF